MNPPDLKLRGQVDFAQFQVVFADEPTTPRIIWLFSMVLGCGMISVGGNFYRVPDATRRRVVEVHTLASEIRIFEDGNLIATHPVLDGRHQRRVAPGHRSAAAQARRPTCTGVAIAGRAGDMITSRPLEFYDAVGRQQARSCS